MEADARDEIERRLSVFDEEPDLNDWVEIFCGASMMVIGIYYLIYPGDLISEQVMQWFASIITAVGIIWAAHGLKDMAVKELRKSIVVLEATSRQDSIDYGLIRDVLMHPDQYKHFLLEAYERAYEDGVLTDNELSELKAIQEVLGVSDEEAAAIATRGAINAAIKDGKVTDEELALIMKAAEDSGLDEDSRAQISKALEDGKIDDEEKKLLDGLLGI